MRRHKRGDKEQTIQCERLHDGSGHVKMTVVQWVESTAVYSNALQRIFTPREQPKGGANRLRRGYHCLFRLFFGGFQLIQAALYRA